MSDFYERGLYWILRERRGLHGGWPPRDVSKVSGWAVVKMLAHLAGTSPRTVAVDVIEHSLRTENGSDE
jgi:hypothetical protein